ncbi:MAG: protein kinase, partial [Verrucomicrobiae bacterium]|nr:protein kinase [Verrucomicrobiae bacterium]
TRDNPLNPDDFFAVAQQALAGISAAHQTGILHRDIKPSNFMIHRDASGHVTVKILDFGLAKFQQEPSLQTVSQDSSILGSIHYLSPEQIHLRPVDFRTDLYALGLVFYYTLVGRPAFNGTVADLIVQHLQHDPAPLEALRPDLPPALCEWLRKMYAKAPESRPATAAAALNELAAIIRNPWVTHYVPDPAQAVEPVRMVPPPVEEIPARAMEHRAAFRAVFWTATIVAGVLILCGVLWWMGKSRSPVAAVPPATPPSVASVPVVASAPAPTVTTAPVGTTVLSPTDLGALKSVFESGGDAVVEGVPVVTGENKAGTILYLNFSRDYTDSLSLVFFKEKDPAFTEDTLRQYIGRRIRVQGPVSEYNGKLQMKIQSLKQIQTP